MITEWNERHDRSVTLPRGFAASAVRCGLKTAGSDLALITASGGAAAAGVFTTNLVHASCVRHSRGVIAGGAARAIVVNAGNANACNGEQGDRDTDATARLVSEQLGIDAGQVLVASTGVIGHRLPMDRMEAGIRDAAPILAEGAETDDAVARAIMTTDTRPKAIAVECASDAWDGVVRIGGVCKGSGMIAPNMATMLCFLTTDADVPAEVLQRALARAAGATFNRVTVDGDTSTNDMALALASGAGAVRIAPGGAAEADFAAALERACRYLAREIARDGEGANRLVSVIVRGAADDGGAARIAKTISESPLVKTAIFGRDPNWGRIMAAAGRAGVAFEPDAADVAISGITVFRAGTGVDFDTEAARAALGEQEVEIVVDLHGGAGSAEYWTCDFSYDYVRINAEYHT